MIVNFRHAGYCCINTQLSAAGVFTNRTMRKETFEKKGLAEVSKLVQQNLSDLLQILDWNMVNNIKLFRLSSDMLPWKSHWFWDQLPELDAVEFLLSQASQRIKAYGQRITMHPGPFNKLASPNPEVVTATVRDLTDHAELMDRLNLPQNHLSPMNIHVGGTYEGKEATKARFIQNFKLLPLTAQLRLTIENDDKPGQWTPRDLLPISEALEIPIVYDFFHYRLNPDTWEWNIPNVSLLAKSLNTWPSEITPLTHWSESRQEEQGDQSIRAQAHSDNVKGPLPKMIENTQHQLIDVEIEAKFKEIACKNFQILQTQTQTQTQTQYESTLI